MATILVIDDQEPIGLLVGTALEAAEYEVLEVFNGRQRLALYWDTPADFVITH